MTALTIVTLGVVVYGIIGRRGYGRALALGGATPVGAALAFGTTAVPTFYAVALGVPLILVVDFLVRSRLPAASPDGRSAPGLRILVVFAVWSILVTLVAPQLFHGAPVAVPGQGLGVLTAGAPTLSNIAQIGYLVLGLCVVAYLARSKHTSVELIGLATGLPMLLSLWDWAHLQLHAIPFPVGFFDNSPGFVFIDTLPGGLPRFRGIFSEPAGLATSALVTIAYMTSRLGQVSGLRRVGVLVVLATAIFLASISTSATFVVVSVVLVVLAGGAAVVHVVFRGRRISRAAILAGCALGIAALWLLPLLADTVEQVVSDKVGSSSFTDRSNVDALAYQLLVRTAGIGGGLGSDRPSSFLAGILSTTGIVGTALFAAAVAVVLIRSSRIPEVRPASWALIALLVTKVVSSPDLADPSGVTWLALGILMHASLTRADDLAADLARLRAIGSYREGPGDHREPSASSARIRRTPGAPSARADGARGG